MGMTEMTARTVLKTGNVILKQMVGFAELIKIVIGSTNVSVVTITNFRSVACRSKIVHVNCKYSANWLLKSFVCSLTFPINFQGDWPWKSDLKGRCACEYGYWFDQDSWSCTLAGVDTSLQSICGFVLNSFKHQVVLKVKYIFFTPQMTQSNVKMLIVLQMMPQNIVLKLAKVQQMQQVKRVF